MRVIIIKDIFWLLPAKLASAELLEVRVLQVASFDVVGVEPVAVVGTGGVAVSAKTSVCATGAEGKADVALDTFVE